MKRTNKKRDFLEIGCTHDGKTVLKLSIPRHLGPNFENCFKTAEGMKVLNTLQEEYSALSDYYKELYQMLIFHHADEILNIADLVAMLHGMLNVWKEK